MHVTNTAYAYSILCESYQFVGRKEGYRYLRVVLYMVAYPKDSLIVLLKIGKCGFQEIHKYIQGGFGGNQIVPTKVWMLQLLYYTYYITYLSLQKKLVCYYFLCIKVEIVVEILFGVF